ncbi:hypothetical protein [Bacteriovorax sp. DB6_IX]|uniref:hypothetical protein n=1 Tax=Bacteriovorax sp. DB6_IX TaxID=1353530 RepID=UPI00038A24A1|nr:hypothetical protein [Bacteriovorax sp. DB6_IX]EQC50885.1 hypothetical protein M901_2571 [Bacteriovorax sp. DB6_IX]
MHSIKTALYIIFLHIVLCTNSWSKQLSIEELQQQNLEIGPQDKITLGQRDYRIIKSLGKGNTTRVFLVENEQGEFALRIPLSSGNFNTFSRYEDYIDAFYLGHRALETQRIRVPKIYEFESQNYLLVEKLELEDSFDLKEFFFYKNKILDKSGSQHYIKAREKLVDFMKTLAPFKDVKDFHLKQLVYSPKQESWLLVDWTLSHELFKDTTDQRVLRKTHFENTWQSVFYEKGGRDDNGVIPEFKADEQTENIIKEIEEAIDRQREMILENEKAQLELRVSQAKNIRSVAELKEYLKAPDFQFSQNYIDGILQSLVEIEQIDLNQILEQTPFYLISDNKDYIKLAESITQKIQRPQELVTLLNMRSTKGIRADWALTMKIQKIITQSERETPISVYRELLQSDLVSDYAKAWIKRERLDPATNLTCQDAILLFK